MATSLLVLMVAGCGDGPRLVPVAGSVTLDGKPLEGATLSFMPVAGNVISTPGSDVTGPDGNFTMTYNGRAGLAPGKYRVLVSKTEEVVPKGMQVPEVFAKASFEKKLMGLTKEVIPPQKMDREVEVPEGGAKDFALDFKSESKKGK
jgi:hypothetical protein